MRKRRKPRLVSLVIPVFNEEEAIPHLQERLLNLTRKLPCRTEVIFVNDGSLDNTARALADWAQENKDTRIINLARNFGHQIAATAGLDYAKGDAVVLMDADLQDPPEVIPKMLEMYCEGYDVVYARRTGREGESGFKKLSAWFFYRLMRLLVHKDLPVDVGDFRLMSSEFLQALRQMRETHRFLRGMTCWVGFRQTSVDFHRASRIAGDSKYPLRKMIAFALTAAFSFSPNPLRLSVFFGLMIASISTGYGIYSILRALIMRDTVPGWTTLVLLQSLLGGSILISIAVLGEYVARTYEQAKQRPLYFISSALNLDVQSSKRNRTIP